MPARDAIHDAVRNALVKDGWTITDDPYVLEYEEFIIYPDLGTDRTLAAERRNERVVIEAKSFLHPSASYEFEHAIGQYELYRILLDIVDPGSKLYLAITEEIHPQVFQGRGVRFVVGKLGMSILVVSFEREEVVAWIE